MGQPLRLLVVDHQAGARECLCELMRALGHSAVGAGSPDAALEELERASFDVLVTHELLDDLVTGTLLIEEGRRRGLLHGVRCVLLTARPLSRLPPDTTQLMSPTEAGRLEALLSTFSPRPPRARTRTGPLRLVLYVRSMTPSSQRALAAVERALAEFPVDSVALDVRDLSRDPELPLEHDVALTPALVPVGVDSARWLMGELDSSGPIVRLLEQAGLQRLQPPPSAARPPSNRAR